MRDLRERLEKLRADAADLALMSRRTSDAGKRELFERLAEELAIEALELELVIKGRAQVQTLLRRKKRWCPLESGLSESDASANCASPQEGAHPRTLRPHLRVAPDALRRINFRLKQLTIHICRCWNNVGGFQSRLHHFPDWFTCGP